MEIFWEKKKKRNQIHAEEIKVTKRQYPSLHLRNLLAKQEGLHIRYPSAQDIRRTQIFFTYPFLFPSKHKKTPNLVNKAEKNAYPSYYKPRLQVKILNSFNYKPHRHK